MNQISTLTVTAKDEWPAAVPAGVETLNPPEPVVVTGRGPGRRAIEIAVAAALLLHALVLTIALVPMQWWDSKPPPPPIPVTVVFEPPIPQPPPRSPDRRKRSRKADPERETP
ncbi:MAG: hypothetical protein U1E53_26775 [Dongiaceae bacterium]